MKRKTLCIALTAIMAGSMLAGCGSSSSSTGSADTAAATAEGSTEAAASDSGDSSGATTLTWALWDESSTVYYQPLIDAFEAEHPDINVEMVDLGSTDYSTVLGTQLSGSDSSFDVVSIKDTPGYVTLVNKGVLEPLDDKISSDGIDLTKYSGIADQLKVGGKLYELPFRSDIWVLYYNKDVFDKAGVDYPTNDMTWDEYDALARSITDTTPGSEVYGAHYHTWRSTIMLDGILDGKHTAADGDYEFAKPYYEMALKEQEDGVCMDYATLKTQGLHYSDAFAQGNIGMMNMGSWFLSTLISKIQSGEYTDCTNWGIVKYPHAEGVEPGSTLSTITCLGIPTSAPNKDAAWEFVKFVCGEEGAEVLAGTGNIPAMTNDQIVNLISSMDGFPTDENSKQALVATNAYLEMPANDKASEIETVLNEQHDLIMTESISVDDGIAAMNEGVQEILNQ
ncbi:MAG: sugar ABC transporter substrate-binding protein [Lachnospiraceae bacterium]|nr:sugar ABC transporter substrate-binding protein [Lachnospiraceae bacterium]